MNIAYHGSFLRQGLEQLGHNIMAIPAEDIDINLRLHKLGRPVDIVIIEPYGSSFSVRGLADCEQETVAWCVDSPLNEFWLLDACKLFDHVFVDQVQTVSSFAKHGLKASWLPLCAQDGYFVKPQEKIHGITFVGTVNQDRTKRANLLKYLGKYAKLNIASNISMTEAQRLLAQSRITLNENLFSGLTLRVFQGMAAASLVFTEEGDGTSEIFGEDKHIVFYNTENIFEKFDAILSSPGHYESVGVAARDLCRKEHTSKARAESLFQSLKTGHAKNLKPSKMEALWHETRAMYSFVRRYGGSLGAIIKNFETIIKNQGAKASEAKVELGNIYARRRMHGPAGKYYLDAATSGNSVAWAKLACLYAARDEKALAKLSAKRFLESVGLEQTGCKSMEEIFLDLARGHAAMGRKFDLGFNKTRQDMFPDTAFEAAQISWQSKPSPASMDMMLQCLAPCKLGGELLPTLQNAILEGILTERQILQTAEIALSYYDYDTANEIITAMKSQK